MTEGYFIALKQEDGRPGRPIGNDEGAIMIFELSSKAEEVKKKLLTSIPGLKLFRVNVVVVGEVIT